MATWGSGDWGTGIWGGGLVSSIKSVGRRMKKLMLSAQKYFNDRR